MRSRGFVVLWIAMAVAMAGVGMVSPLLPVYVRDELGGPELAVALSFSGLAMTQLAASPLVGRLGDRYGPKPLIVAGFTIYAAAGIGYLFANQWELVLVFRFVSGVGAAAIFPMALAYVGRLAPRGREGAYMGMYSVAEVAGFGVGPLIGGSMRDLVSSEAAFGVMSGMLGATGLLTLLALPQMPGMRNPDEEEQTGGPRHELPMRMVARSALVQAAVLARAAANFGWGAGATFLAVYVVSEDGLDTGSATFVGILLASRSLLGGLTQPLTGRLADRVGRGPLVAIGLSVAAAGQFIIPDLPSTAVDVSVLSDEVVIVPWLLATFVVIGLAEAVVWPAQQALFVEAGRRSGMGTVMAINQMGSSAGFLSGSLLGALVVSLFGLEAVFRFAGLLVGLGAVVFWWRMRLANAELVEYLRVEPVVGGAAGDK